MKDIQNKSVDLSITKLLRKAREDGVTTSFDRVETMLPCPIGRSGACCSTCFMGPCRLSEKEGKEKGICGATLPTVASRNLARSIAAGTAAHAAIARDLAFLLKAIATGEVRGFEIRDVQKLKMLAREFGFDGKESINVLAEKVADVFLEQFSSKRDELIFVRRAPEKRQKLWREAGITPRSVDYEVSETISRTGIGTDQDYRNILFQAMRTALADGWGSSMISTELSDVLFGTPKPVVSEANMGVLKKDSVNVVVHGHYPLVAEALRRMSKDLELLKYASSKGANSINLVGLCCTASEVLMRYGIPAVGNFLQQEMVIVSGLVDAMVVDMQCIFEALVDIASHYHTTIITTSPQAKISDALHIEFTPENAIEKAREVIKLAIKNFTRRVNTEDNSFTKSQLVSGFSYEYILRMLGGNYLASLRPLNEAIIDGRLPGVAAVVGCNNPRVSHDKGHNYIVRELIRNNVLVFQTGCSALASAKSGLMVPEAKEEAGPILKVVCKSVGIPPVLHVGSCVDNSRILMLLSRMVTDGGLGDDISDLPVAGVCPEWMSEKSLSIGAFFAASGVYTIFGVGSPVDASPEISHFLENELEEKLGGKLEFEPSQDAIVEKVIECLRSKREALGIGHEKDREVHDVEKRRELLWWRNQLRLWPKPQSRVHRRL